MPTNLDFATSNSAPAANSTTPELGKVLENLNQFIASVPSVNEDKVVPLVSQQELDLLTSVFTVGKGQVDSQLLKRHCEKAQIAFPAKLSRQITSRQVKDLIYSLALGIRNNLTNGSEESRYLYLPIFCFKSESIVTQFLNSYTLYRNPNSRVAPRGLKCSVRYFDKICENLDTRPVFLKHLINNISRSFYARENKLGHFHLHHNLSDAYYFAKVLCMLKHQLIANRLFS